MKPKPLCQTSLSKIDNIIRFNYSIFVGFLGDTKKKFRGFLHVSLSLSFSIEGGETRETLEFLLPFSDIFPLIDLLSSDQYGRRKR